MDVEAGMPRWRRPSLLAARKSDPHEAAAPVTRLAFEADDTTFPGAPERRFVRYHVVELLDAPDEVRARRVRSLTEGDQVELLERSGSFWLVRCPDGSQGWVHRMALGEVVGPRPS